MRAGQAIGHYQIVSELGQGGMGEVYLAQDAKLDRKVALKILPADVAANEDQMRRFVQEAKATSALNHPNIVTIHEIDRADSISFISTEFIDGETLRQRIRKAPMKLGEVLDVAIQVASALNAAHAAGIIHRDIKPENIMIRHDGIVKVLDFGLAKLTQPVTGEVATEAQTERLIQTEAGLVMGTVAYMSPEQARGLAVDLRTDIWSLGVVIYEMIASHAPFKGATTADLLSEILQNAALPLAPYSVDVPTEIDHLIQKCLDKDRERRYQSAQELLVDLRTLSTKFTAEQSATKTSPSIAVLPFVNTSADPENEYFCDGLAEEILNALAKVEQLRVVARTSAFFFKHKEADVREIGRKLNVNTVLEGSVRRAGDRLRISAQLINVADGYHLWSERYDRQVEDVFKIQDEITLAIVNALKLKLLQEEKSLLLKRHTENTEAYWLYLKGLYHHNQATGEGFRKAIEYYQQSIEIEPNYALPYAQMADDYGAAAYFSHLAPNETLPLISAALESALRLDATLAQAHLVLAKRRFFYDWDFPGAGREFRRAIELNPNSAEAHGFYAHYLAATGAFSEAVIEKCTAEAKRAHELDPLSLMVNVGLGYTFLYAQEWDQAFDQARKLLRMEPDFSGAHLLLAHVCFVKNMYAEALAACQRAVDLRGGPRTRACHGFVCGVSGKRGDARREIEELNLMKQRCFVSSYDFALVYAGLGELDEAFKFLDRSFEERNGPMATLNIDPLLSVILRAEPRFAELVRRIGLPQWRGVSVQTGQGALQQ